MLNRFRLWVKPEFWKVDGSDRQRFESAKNHMAFIMDQAIEDRLLAHREIVEGIGVSRLVEHLPLNELQAIIEQTLSNSHDGKPFTETDLLRTVPTQKMVGHVPLALLWESVIRPKVAERNGLLGSPGAKGQTTTTSAKSKDLAEELGLSGPKFGLKDGRG